MLLGLLWALFGLLRGWISGESRKWKRRYQAACPSCAITIRFRVPPGKTFKGACPKCKAALTLSTKNDVAFLQHE